MIKILRWLPGYVTNAFGIKESHYFCPKCNTSSKHQTNYCFNCGQQLKRSKIILHSHNKGKFDF
jgi:predicted amidophosphoribosyltransferase